MTLTSTIKTALEKADPIISDLVRQLQAKVRTLQQENAQLQAENRSQQAKIAAMEQELQEIDPSRGRGNFKLIIQDPEGHPISPFD